MISSRRSSPPWKENRPEAARESRTTTKALHMGLGSKKLHGRQASRGSGRGATVAGNFGSFARTGPSPRPSIGKGDSWWRRSTNEATVDIRFPALVVCGQETLEDTINVESLFSICRKPQMKNGTPNCPWMNRYAKIIQHTYIFEYKVFCSTNKLKHHRSYFKDGKTDKSEVAGSGRVLDRPLKLGSRLDESGPTSLYTPLWLSCTPSGRSIVASCRWMTAMAMRHTPWMLRSAMVYCVR